MRPLDRLLERESLESFDIEDFGGLEGLPGIIPSLKDHPLLPVLVRVLAEYYSATPFALPSSIAKPLLNTLCESERPAIFRDVADLVLQSAAFLDALGTDLAQRVLKLATPPAANTTAVQALLAADALEIATELRLRKYCARWDLYAHLSSYDATTGPPDDESYPRAVLRSIVACVEHWEEADDLVKVLKRVAGIEVGPHIEAIVPERLSDSDTGMALSRVETLRALRAQDREQALLHLQNALRYLRTARAEDDARADIAAWNSVVILLTQLITSGRVVEPFVIDSIRENTRELMHFDPKRYHWFGDRVAASRQAWAQLSVQLHSAHSRLSETSWYHAAETVHCIVNLYRVTSSTKVLCRTEDGESLHKIIAPTLEGGFADNVALLKHLQDHVTELKSKTQVSDLSEGDQCELQVAEQLLGKACERFSLDHREDPKAVAGAPITGSGDASAATERVLAAVEQRKTAEDFSLGSLLADEVYERMRMDFAGSPDYVDAVAEATDLVSGLLVRFVWDRNQLGESDAPYLYDQSAHEEDLANDLHNFLRGSGSLGAITTEIRRVAGGRVDIQFGFPGFNLYVELKVDSTKKAIRDKQAYLRQAASYTVADKRISFLVVLRLASEKRMMPPHLSDAVQVVTVNDSEGKPRHVGVFELPGARTKPSSM